MHTFKFIPDADHIMHKHLADARQLNMDLGNCIKWFGVINIDKHARLTKQARESKHYCITEFRKLFPEYNEYEVKIGFYHVNNHRTTWCIDVKVPLL